MNLTKTDVLTLLKRPSFTAGPYSFVSQDPTAITARRLDYMAEHIFPVFVLFWRDLERATGHRWKCTSLIRNSPSHRRGHSIDFAPDFAPEAAHLYAATNMSDPVLYKRERLVRQLQSLKHRRYTPLGDLGVFIEPDHLHVQLVRRGAGSLAAVNVAKWGQPKPVYKDTYQRMQLPVFKDNG